MSITVNRINRTETRLTDWLRHKRLSIFVEECEYWFFGKRTAFEARLCHELCYGNVLSVYGKTVPDAIQRLVKSIKAYKHLPYGHGFNKRTISVPYNLVNDWKESV